MISPAGPKLPLIDRQSPASRFGVLFAECRDLHAANLLIGQIMGHAHEADARNADANHVVCSGRIDGQVVQWQSSDYSVAWSQSLTDITVNREMRFASMRSQ